MGLILKVNIPNQEEFVVDLDRPQILIGTLSTNFVSIDAPDIDAIHAMIESNPHGWEIIDLGSDSGVYVNNKKIDVDEPLKIGDKVRIGSVDLSLENKRLSAERPRKIQILTPPLPKDRPATLPDESDSLLLGMPPSIDSEEAPVSLAKPGLESTQGTSKKVKDTQSTNFEEVVSAEEPQMLSEADSINEELNQEDSLQEKSEQEPAYIHDDEADDATQEDTGIDERLFPPKKASPEGQILEVVCYWGHTVLGVEHFSSKEKGFESAVIGNDPKKSHLVSGSDQFEQHTLAKAGDDSFSLHLSSDMRARIRKEGKVQKVDGASDFEMGKRDVAQVKCGPLQYFLMHVRPPKVVLLKKKTDPVFQILGLVVFLCFTSIMLMVLTGEAHNKEKDGIEDDIAIVVPTKVFRKVKEKAKKEKIKPVQDLAKKAKPVPKPPKPVKPIKKPPTKPKDIKTPVPPTTVKPTVKPSTKPPTTKPSTVNQSRGLIGNNKGKTDNKLKGPKKNTKLGRAGGNKGGGDGSKGAAIKGKDRENNKGTSTGKSKKSGGRSLGGLGIGTKILSKPGGTPSFVKNSDKGGNSQRMGTGKRTLGHGGSGTIGSVRVGGAKGVSGFGQGTGGFNSGQGGLGGNGGAGLAPGDGRARANVSINEGGVDVAGGGLTSEEINRVIRASKGSFRSCYQSLLQSNPGISGDIKIKFVIGPAGRVTSSSPSSVSSKFNGTNMGSCMSGKMRQLGFPKPRGGVSVTVNYPFSFSAR